MKTMDREKTDPARIAEWLRLFIEPGQVTELRAVKVSPDDRWSHTVSGFFDFDHLPGMAKEAARLSAIARGVYFIPNPLEPAILCKCANRTAKADNDSLAHDGAVSRRKWLLIDADPVRPVAGVSATDAEKADAWETIRAVRSYLDTEGWPAPILADSGNGYHLLYRIDLPRDDGGLVQRVLQELARRFDSDSVKIDQNVFNPSRICKLYGTLARKGDHTAERPHRLSAILEAPGE
jgi:hypothetical protein